MPLLNGKLDIPHSEGPDLTIGNAEDTRKFFRVERTGEVFSSYEDYVNRLRQVTSRNWGSVRSGKQGLSYEEAVLEDRDAEALIAKFPKELEEVALKKAHHSLLPLEELVSQIHSSHCSPAPSDKENGLALGQPNGNPPGEDRPPLEASALNVPPESIRCWLLKAARVEDHGPNSVWVANPEYQQQYSLAQGVPPNLALPTSPTAQGNGTDKEKAPKRKREQQLENGQPKAGKKPKADGATATKKKAQGPDTAEAEPKVSKKRKKAEEGTPSKAGEPKEGSGEGGVGEAKEEEPWQPPPVKTIEEEEQGLKEGTNKAIVFPILKAAGPEGLTVAQIVEKVREAGKTDYDDSHKKHLGTILAGDPTFVRVTKGVYALRTLMGDLPYEAVGRPRKRVRKSRAGQSRGASATPGKAKTGVTPRKSTPGKSPAEQSPLGTKKAKKAKEAAATPAGPSSASPEAPWKPPLKTLEEEEKRVKPGTRKEAVFKVLKVAGAEGRTVLQIMEDSKQQGIREFAETEKKAVQNTLLGDTAFVRVSKGVYAIRALMGDAPYEAIGRPQPGKGKGTKKASVDPKMVAGLLGAAPTANGEAAPEQSEQEAQSLTKAQQIELSVKTALATHQAALARALASQEKAQTRLQGAIKEPRTPSKRKHEDALGPMPDFGPTEEEKAYQGDPTSKEDMAAHTARMATLQQEQERRTKEWEEKLRLAREEDARVSGHEEVAKAQRAVKSAQKKVAARQTEVASAAQALKEAKLAAQRESSKAAAAEKKAAEKKARADAREEARAAERERKRLELERKKEEALEAKRYPMEDLQLLEELAAKAATDGTEPPVADVPLPEEWLSEADSAATSGLLYVADLVSVFSKALKVKPAAYQDLLALLGDEPAPQAANEALWELYLGLLRSNLKEMEQDSPAQDWLDVLDRGTLTEVLRRHLGALKRSRPSLVEQGVANALGALEGCALDELDGQQHQMLLCLLCDQAVEGETMRDALQGRMDESDGVKREMREVVAEKKGELKELLEAEREEKRKKREDERAAKKAKEEAEKKAQGEAAAAGQEAAGNADGAQGAAGNLEGGAPGGEPMEIDPSAKPATPPTTVQENEEDALEPEEEPSWDLPAELQEFQGEADDRKGMLAFRQKQQSARQRLDKEKAKWQAAARERAKQREAREKALAEVERAKERAKADAEEEVARKQEEFERELEKFNIRRDPLGMDRQHRRYWWGVAGQRSLVYVEDDQGRWGVLSTPAQLDALIAALETRGIREAALHEALQKVYGSIVQAMKKAPAEPKLSKAAGALATPAAAASAPEASDRFPKRARAQAVFFSPSKAAKDSRKAKDAATATGGLSGASLDSIVAALDGLQESMRERGVAPPAEGWKSWCAGYRNATKDAKAAFEAEGSHESVHGALKTCLMNAEEMLHAFMPGAYKSTPDEEEESSPEKGVKTRGTLWRGQGERASWVVSVMEAKTLHGIAFEAARLELAGTALLSSMKQPKAKAKPEKAKAAAPEKPQKGAANGKAKGGSQEAQKAKPSSKHAEPIGDPVGRTRAARQATEAEPAASPKAADKSKKSAAKGAKPASRGDPAGRTRAAKPAAEAPASPKPAGKGKKRASEPQETKRVTRARAS